MFHFDNVFSVTSIGSSDNHEKNIGDPNSTHQHNDMVDLCAPGYDVKVQPDHNWELYSSGTSFAAPFVSGTVALMLSVNHCLDNEDIELILKHVRTCAWALSCAPLPTEFATKVRTIVATPSAGMNVNCMQRIVYGNVFVQNPRNNSTILPLPFDANRGINMVHCDVLESHIMNSTRYFRSNCNTTTAL